MQINWKKNILPHVLALVIFIVLSFIYCSPVLQGDTLQQSDMVQVQGMTKEARDFYDKTGERPLWSNSMFGGMPTYTSYTGPSTNQLTWVNQLFTLFLPQPVNMLFIAMLGLYFLLSVLGLQYWIRIFGAVAYGFSSFNVIIIGVGHITQMMCMAWMAPIFAGMILVYRGKYILGGVITALATGLLIYNNHLQIIYYTFIMVVCLAIGQFIYQWKRKNLRTFFIGSAVLVIAAILAVLPSMENLMITKEFAQYTIRGSQSEITLQNKTESDFQKGGLDIDYAYQWSLGKLETFSILIPNIVGGPPPSQDFVTSSETYNKLTQMGASPQQAAGIASQYLYWGPQPFTSPVYFGAVICFLFILSLFLIKSPHKWWLLVVTILGFVMAWGKNFGVFNNFLFYHLPFYNKFRAPSMSLIIPQLTMVWMSCWGLQEILSGKTSRKDAWDAVKKTLYICGGLVILLMVVPGALLDYAGNNDAQFQGAQAEILRYLRADRASLLHKDGFRSLILVLIMAAALWGYVKEKIKLQPFLAIIGIVLIFDLFQVDKRYLNNDSFLPQDQYATLVQPSACDRQIMQDKDPYYRVLNLSTSTFNDAITSYFHKSVGGYSPAKLWVYQDLIDYQIAPEMQRIIGMLQGKQSLDSNDLAVFYSSPVLNMLNTKYFIINPQGAPVTNPNALGNAWFVKGVRWAKNANEEITALSGLDVKDSAVVDQRFQQQVDQLPAGEDSAAQISLTQYGLNELQYTSSNTANGLAVFSDIYYPAGWKAFIDGKETPILRVNYALRGLVIPAGKHQVDFKFHPDTFFTGQKISGISSILLLLIFVGGLGMEIFRKKEVTVEEKKA
jgi:hypothetical protein